MNTLRNSDNCSQEPSHQPFPNWITLIYFADKMGKVTRLGFCNAFYAGRCISITSWCLVGHTVYAAWSCMLCSEAAGHVPQAARNKGRNNMLGGYVYMHGILRLRHDYKTRRLHAQQLYRNILIHMSTSISLISCTGALLVWWRGWPGVLFHLFTGKYSHPFQGN